MAGRPPTRASREAIQNIPLRARFCPFEKCPPHTFLYASRKPAPPASSITRRFERLLLNRRRLSLSEMTQSP